MCIKQREHLMTVATQDKCVQVVTQWTLNALEGVELEENTIHFAAEQAMRDWDLYCGRDYPELPELNDDEWEGCLESVRDTVEYRLCDS